MRRKIYTFISICLLSGFAFGVFKCSGSLNEARWPQSGAEHQSEDEIPKISWRVLNRFDHKSRKGPRELMEMDGKLVEIPGFIVPLTDSYSDFDEFLLVPDAQSCIHIPPPPPNLIVSVKLRKAISMGDIFYPSWVKGVFRIEHSNSQYGGSSYTLDATEIRKFEFKEK